MITRFETSAKEIWLTIDDGPAGDTLALLDLFDVHQVRATFFVKGVLAAAHPGVVRGIVARGHSIASHSHTHPSATWWCAPPSRVAAEIDRCNEVLARLTGERPRWFRAPVGMKNPAVHPALRRRGMRLIGWSARCFDTVVSDPERALARLLPEVRPGAILMMHQGHEHSVRVLERVIAALQEQGYSFVIPADGQLRT